MFFQSFLGTYTTVCSADFAASVSYEQVYATMSSASNCILEIT